MATIMFKTMRSGDVARISFFRRSARSPSITPDTTIATASMNAVFASCVYFHAPNPTPTATTITIKSRFKKDGRLISVCTSLGSVSFSGVSGNIFKNSLNRFKNMLDLGHLAVKINSPRQQPCHVNNSQYFFPQLQPPTTPLFDADPAYFVGKNNDAYKKESPAQRHAMHVHPETERDRHRQQNNDQQPVRFLHTPVRIKRQGSHARLAR